MPSLSAVFLAALPLAPVASAAETAAVIPVPPKYYVSAGENECKNTNGCYFNFATPAPGYYLELRSVSCMVSAPGTPNYAGASVNASVGSNVRVEYQLVTQKWAVQYNISHWTLYLPTSVIVQPGAKLSVGLYLTTSSGVQKSTFVRCSASGVYSPS